jgi:hypothetical protein
MVLLLEISVFFIFYLLVSAHLAHENRNAMKLDGQVFLFPFLFCWNVNVFHSVVVLLQILIFLFGCAICAPASS